MVISLALIDTQPGRDVASLIEEGEDVHARPLWDGDESEYEVVGERATVTRAVFSYILVRAVDVAEGLDPLVPVEERRVLPWARRRMLLV